MFSIEYHSIKLKLKFITIKNKFQIQPQKTKIHENTSKLKIKWDRPRNYYQKLEVPSKSNRKFFGNLKASALDKVLSKNVL